MMVVPVVLTAQEVQDITDDLNRQMGGEDQHALKGRCIDLGVKFATLQAQKAHDEAKVQEANNNTAILLTQLNNDLGAERAKVVAEQSKVAAKKAKLLIERGKVATEQGKVATEQANLLGEQAKVLAEQRKVAAKKAKIAKLEAELEAARANSYTNIVRPTCMFLGFAASAYLAYNNPVTLANYVNIGLRAVNSPMTFQSLNASVLGYGHGLATVVASLLGAATAGVFVPGLSKLVLKFINIVPNMLIWMINKGLEYKGLVMVVAIALILGYYNPTVNSMVCSSYQWLLADAVAKLKLELPLMLESVMDGVLDGGAQLMAAARARMA